MAPRREILDSDDDDGDGFADAPPMSSPTAAPLPDDDATAPAGTSSSTDPSFFQRVYEEQQAVMVGGDIGGGDEPWAGATTETSFAPPPCGQKQQPQSGSSSLSSLGTSDAEQQGAHQIDGNEPNGVDAIIDLTGPTQLATPRKGGVSNEDVAQPGSANSFPSVGKMVTKTYGKRKRGQQSSPREEEEMVPTQDPYDFLMDDSPARSTRGRKRAAAKAVVQAHSSPVVLLPGEDKKSSGRRRGGNTGSSMLDTDPPALYVTQSTLSLSQRQQYKTVSLGPSSDGLVGGAEEIPACKSSGMSTIAYPTPSRAVLQSSPDVLVDMPPPSTKRKRGRMGSSAGSLSMPTAEGPLVDAGTATRSSKRRRSALVEEERDTAAMGGDDAIPDAAETSEPVWQDTTGEATSALPAYEPDLPALPDEPVIDSASTVSAQSEPPAKKKRGRKKKEPTPTRPTPEEPDEPNILPAEEAPKKRRGRPRKSDTTTKSLVSPEQPPAADDDDVQIQQDYQKEEPKHTSLTDREPTSSNSQPAPRRAPKKTKKEIIDSDDENHDDDDYEKENKQVQSDEKEEKTPQNPSPAPAAVLKKEVDKKESTLANSKAVGATAAGKVKYRVGLSRNSRIAPLLKSLKKP